ncbi:MAG TPA: cupin domain-containing protein [Chitinophagaceae bacterium]|nr:cupin domain-containing protein [Chitinophagaceae bacterium]
MTPLPAQFWIDHLHLEYHIEGGSFAETYRSSLTLGDLAGGFNGPRNACTHIYFLLQRDQFSAFHRIRSDELWHFYSGDPLIVYEIDPDGHLTEHLLGNDPRKGHSLFCVIHAGSWFASRVLNDGDYSLVGCTVSPGFDFEDFELAKADELATTYKEHEGLIREMSKRN